MTRTKNTLVEKMESIMKVLSTIFKLRARQIREPFFRAIMCGVESVL